MVSVHCRYNYVYKHLIIGMYYHYTCINTVRTVAMSTRFRKTRSKNTEVRVVASAIYQGKPCHPSILCKASNLSKHFHPMSWKDATLYENLRKYGPSVDVQLDSCRVSH